jgi:hypothetical protein
MAGAYPSGAPNSGQIYDQAYYVLTENLASFSRLLLTVKKVRAYPSEGGVLASPVYIRLGRKN